MHQAKISIRKKNSISMQCAKTVRIHAKLVTNEMSKLLRHHYY